MLRRAAALFLMSVGVFVCVSCTGTKSHFVYLTVPASNEVNVYREDPNSGILTAIQTSPYTVGTASAPQALVMHPTQKFLYIANSQENDISLFDMSTSDGTISEVTPRTPAGSSPFLLAMDPSGNYLYAANAQSNSISAYSINTSDGNLTAVAGSPFPIGIFPLSMKLTPSGDFLYVGGAGSPGVVEAFSVNAGVLTAIGAYQTGTNPAGIEIDSTSTYLYTANTGDSSISEFTIGSTGILSQMANSPVGETTTGQAPVAILIDPSGTYLYVANEGSSNIVGYTVSSTSGALTLLPNPSIPTGTHPNTLAADQNGKYILVGTQSGTVQNFGLDLNSGAITIIASYNTGSTPGSIAVTH
jgi:6-phosphogluconolactonase